MLKSKVVIKYLNFYLQPSLSHLDRSLSCFNLQATSIYFPLNAVARKTKHLDLLLPERIFLDSTYLLKEHCELTRDLLNF